MNLVCRKSKIRVKTDLGAWGRRQAQPGDWGKISDQRDQGKDRLQRGKGDLERRWGGGGGGGVR